MIFFPCFFGGGEEPDVPTEFLQPVAESSELLYCHVDLFLCAKRKCLCSLIVIMFNAYA